jgi:hypothetical protein
VLTTVERYVAECNLFCGLVQIAGVNLNLLVFQKKMALSLTLKLENCAFLRYYAACSGNSLPTFRDNLSVHLKMDF